MLQQRSWWGKGRGERLSQSRGIRQADRQSRGRRMREKKTEQSAMAGTSAGAEPHDLASGTVS